MIRTVTLKKLDLFGIYKSIRIKELPTSYGWICWKGMAKIFPELARELDKGKEIKVILSVGEEI